MYTLAIDVGGTKLTMAVFDGDTLIARERRATDREGGRQWMLDRIYEIAEPWCREWNIARCGIGFGGPVYFDRQVIALSTHVGGWHDYPLAAEIGTTLGVPSIMDNDANVGALGEARHGAGIGCDPLFYMTLSTGIGGGLMVAGHLVRGADSYAGEIGHLTIQPDGPECLCGARGCFERICSGLWLEHDFGKPAQALLAEPAFVEQYVVPLARGLKACIMLLNPERIVIGGGISKAGDALFLPLRRELSRQITGWSSARIDIQPASLGDDSVLYGALELAKLYAGE